MFELHVLGTSSARFAHGRSVSGSVINTPGGLALIDCGEGMQNRVIMHNRNLKKSGRDNRTRLSRIRAIFLTHGHLDHSWGVLPLLQTLNLDGRKNPLTIIGPTTNEAMEWAKNHPGETPPIESDISPTDLAILFSQWQAIGAKDELSYTINWVPIIIDRDLPFTCPEQPLDGVNVTILPTTHGVPSCAYHFETQRKPRFNREKAEQLQLSDSQISRLASGENIDHGGNDLRAEDFRSETRPNCSIVVSGDTVFGPPGFDINHLPSPPNLLLHESTFTSENQEKATQYFHSTATDAAKHASKCKAGVLALTHYSSRIERLSPLVSEAREHFSGPVAATSDGDWFRVDSDGKVTHYVRIEEGWNQMIL